MSNSLKIYGFGSFFKVRSTVPNDIDLLLIHQDFTAPSIKLAIKCKKFLITEFQKAHVVMLSQKEADIFNFLKLSEAIFIDELSEICASENLISLKTKILAHK